MGCLSIEGDMKPSIHHDIAISMLHFLINLPLHFKDMFVILKKDPEILDDW